MEHCDQTDVCVHGLLSVCDVKPAGGERRTSVLNRVQVTAVQQPNAAKVDLAGMHVIFWSRDVCHTQDLE